MTDLQKIERLKEAVFAQCNEHCFIERERFMNAQPVPPIENRPGDFYAKLFSGLLDSVSTPVDDNDVFVGRVVEGAPESSGPCPNRLLIAKGHLTPDYTRLLTLGYNGILAEIRQSAARLGTKQANDYLASAEIAVSAIGRFAKRYAEAAARAGKHRAAEALCRVPLEPAYDLYSALQAVWLVHMISSAYVGYRDYGFGYMDEYLYPYYLAEKKRGTTENEIRLMLAGFFIKPNEICGRATHNYKQKPIPSQASKQYVLLDGGKANELSALMLEAAAMTCMAQPEITVILSESSPADFVKKVFETMSVTTDKLQVYNGDVLQRFLKSKGLPQEIVDRPAFTACCTFDIYRHTCREEYYMPTVQLFYDTLCSRSFDSKEELLRAFGDAITADCERYLQESRYPDREWARTVYMLDALLLSTCNENCDYPPYGARYRAKNIFLPGLATLGDSLCALDMTVFHGDLPYGEMIKALQTDFEGWEALHSRLLALPKFGNDNAEDRYTVEMAELMIAAVERARHEENEIVAPSFYSLQRENEWAENTPATPDGKRAGTACSENQSPVYGADKKGITALLCSLAKIPFEKTAAGGLNLTFSAPVRGDILQVLVKTYFQSGGMHVGMTVLDHNTLRDAMVHPEKYRSLTVRLYGFSEYFISLPEWQQLAVLERTAYEV
jgi:formate C-acetyltransferase